MSEADARFYFDPVCPFAWMTSKWVRVVQEQRGYTVDWRFISLRMVNADLDYDTHFPPGYIAGHTAGLRLLRVAAAARARSGPGAVGRLVISRLPSAADAVRLWDHVVGLATFPGFAELKRSLREMPQLRSFGVEPDGQR
jgi:hypothetical protein